MEIITSTITELEITKLELEDWKKHPVTQALFERLTEERNTFLGYLMSGGTVECEYSSEKTARYVGSLYGIDMSLFIQATKKEE